jgi:DNA-binding transcriptional MerR regulator
MLIQVGELAKRAGMTVRTLHHYEQTGLLTPSARSEAGYRLYNLSAVQRLHMIKALAQAGLDARHHQGLSRSANAVAAELLTQQIETLTPSCAMSAGCATGCWCCARRWRAAMNPIWSPGYRRWS